jgi:hypothetical protein
MPSEEAQKKISKQVEVMRDKGFPEKQAVAIGYEKAREEGYKVPKAEAYEDADKDKTFEDHVRDFIKGCSKYMKMD